jgi:hypothetical protein
MPSGGLYTARSGTRGIRTAGDGTVGSGVDGSRVKR